MPRFAVALFFAIALALGYSNSAPAQDLDCADFATQADAQANADATGDANNLDPDGDGFACESSSVASGPAPTAGCDPAYTNYCIPPVWVYGDLSCEELGIYNVYLADPYNDPHGLDIWDGVGDGIGCEG